MVAITINNIMSSNKKNIICITVFLLIICNSIISQTNKNINKKFNLEGFIYESEIYEAKRDTKIKRNFRIYRGKKVKGDTVITLRYEDERGYAVTERINNNAFSTWKIYLKPSLISYGETICFYDLSIFSTTYDDNGNVIKTRDFEKEQGYSFTIEMLIEKFKNEFDIDLTCPYNYYPFTGNYMRVDRWHREDVPIYIVYIPISVEDGYLILQRTVEVDGVSGEVMSDITKHPPLGHKK